MSAVRDLRSNIASDLASYRHFLGNETHSSYILDTADYDSGIMLSFSVHNYVDGTYTSVIYESNDSGMASKNVVADENLIGSSSDLVFTSSTSPGASMTTIGIVGTKRYIQIDTTTTGVVTAGEMTVVTSKIPEILRVE